MKSLSKTLIKALLSGVISGLALKKKVILPVIGDRWKTKNATDYTDFTDL
jgi:hypothetical protein